MEPDAELDALVVEQFPAVRLTRDLVRQLAQLLPIRSADELRRALEDTPLVVDNEKVDLGDTLEVLPEEAFPIEDLRGLVGKVAAAVRIGSSLVVDGRIQPRSEQLARLALDVAVAPVATGRPGIPAGHFAGPSLFGYSKEA
jgi:hypothetical protein